MGAKVKKTMLKATRAIKKIQTAFITVLALIFGINIK